MEKKEKKAEIGGSVSENLNSQDPGSLNKKISELELQVRYLKRNQEIYQRNEKQFSDILETVQEGIIYTTLKGKILYTNIFFERLIGLSKEDLVGRNIIERTESVLSGENLSVAVSFLSDLLAGKVVKPFSLNYKDKILEVDASVNARVNRLSITIRDVTDRMRSEEALLKSETRLRRAELASRSGNWELHLDTRTIIGSEGAMKLYGISRPVCDYDTVKPVPLPEYRAMLDKAFTDLVENNKPYNLEFKIRNISTGEILDIHSICEYDRKNGVLFGSIQDITDRKKAEEEIKKKNRSLAKLLEIAMEILETVDRDKIMKTIAEGSTKLIDMETSAIYSVRGDDLILEATTPGLPHDFPDEFRRSRLENHPHIHQVVLTKSHNVLYNSGNAELTPEERIIVDQRGLNSILYLPLVTNKKVAAVLILGSVGRIHEFDEQEIDLCRTLSSLVSLSLENSELFENLTIAKDKAEESDKLKTAFLHNISHEIRTPLNAIVGFSGFLDQPDITSGERQEYIDIIFQSNNQLLAIINDILNISQIETGLVTVHDTTINVGIILKNLHRQFLDDSLRAGIEFRLRILDSGENDLILTDEGKLVQILTNLLNNAIKFTHEGFIELGYLRKDNIVEFYVEDSGIGIPESEHTKIFERFYQVDKTVSRLYSGTGLGLSISKAYAEMLDGAVSVDSTPGKGSRFSLRIPYKRVSAEPVTQVTGPVNKEGSLSGGRTILVAEDEESNYALVMALLKPLGFKMIRAKNGKSAVEIFSIHPEIDLILMDIKMPLMDGFEATREILKLKPGMPIIAQTAYAHPADRTRALSTGCVDYLAKPFDRQELIDMVNKYLRQE